MKIKIINTSLFLLLFTSAFSQSWKQMESEFYNLLRKNENKIAKNKAFEILTWAKLNHSDTSLILPQSYRLLGDAYYSENADSSIFYYKQSKTLLQFQKRQNTLLSAKIHYNLANLYAQKKEYDSYYINLKESVKINRDLKYPEFPFSEVVIEQLYDFELAKKEYDLAESLLLECLFVFNIYSKQYTEQCASVLQSLGTFYFTKTDNFTLAEKYIVASIQAYKNSIGEENLFCSGNYFWLAEIYDRNEDYISAEKCHLKSLDIYNKILPSLDDKEKELYYYPALEGLAQYYWGLGLYVKSQDAYKKVRSIYIEKKDTLRIISLIVPMSISFIDNKDFDLAKVFLTNQLKYFSNISNNNIKDYLPVLRSLTLTYDAIDSTENVRFLVSENLK